MAVARPSPNMLVRTASGRGPSSRAGAPASGSQLSASLLGFARRRWGMLLTVGAVGAFSSAIGWNVLVHQKARHPAPLFGSASAPQAVEPTRKPDLAAAAPLPVPRPEPVADAPAPEAAKASANDPIGALIRASANARTDADIRLEPARVAAAQKALSKLGYGPLKADGVAGATTRQALERFERDQNIPVTGSLGTRTSRQLASKAGLPID